jgi:dephospho-CoA kinase
MPHLNGWAGEGKPPAREGVEPERGTRLAVSREPPYGQRMLVFGLTGGLASGKSTVAARFSARGVPVLDADVSARRVVEPGSEGLAAVAAAFGTDVVDAQGALDRKALAARVFAEETARRRLESILHPRIQAVMLAWKAELEARAVPLACYEAPLLVEVGLADALRPLVVVSAPPEQQVSRAMQRDGLDEPAARARLKAQLPLEEKVKKADFVIENDGTKTELIERADRVLDAIVTFAGLSPENYPKP